MINKVIGILVNFTDFDAKSITEKTDLQNELGLNSLDVINMIVAFEDEFGIEIPDRVISQFVTVGDIVKYLETIES